MKYVQFDDQDRLTARYDSGIHGDNIPQDAVEISDALFWRTINETDGVWKRDAATGNIDKQPFPAPTHAQIETQKVALVQAHMDAAAQALNYDNIATACTYADEPSVPKFQAEGQAFRAWRSAVWSKCYSILAAVNAGTTPVPSDTDLIAELPALVLPK